MHWIIWAILACLVFLASYNPRTGSVTKYFVDPAPEPRKYFAQKTSVEDGITSRTPQSDSDSDE